MSKYDNILVLNGVKYFPFEYKEEKTLERDVKRNIKHIFGENAWPIPKLKIKPSEGSRRIPDLYVLDIIAKKLFVVEVERISHSIPDHITPQISGFYRILKDTSSRSDLLDKLYDEVTKNSTIRGAFKDLGIEEIHKFLADVLVQSYEVVLIIDNITKELKNAFRYMNPSPEILEFKRFKKAYSEIFIYEMDTLERDVATDGSIMTDSINKNPTLSNRDDITAMISPGEHIYMKYNGDTYIATIEAGGIRLADGSIETTPSGAAKKITGWPTANGWKC